MHPSLLKKGIATVTAVGTVSLLLAGCASQNGSSGTGAQKSSSTSPGQPVEGGSINIELAKDVQTLDPAVAEDTSSEEIMNSLYDQLVTYKGPTNQLVGDLATSWDVSNGGKTYTFHLRKGVKFWNGDTLTANDFIAEFERVLDKQTGSPWESYLDPIVKGSTAYHNGQAKSVSGLSAPDPNTLKIELVKPEPFFIQVMAMHFMSAVDPTWIQKVGENKFGTSSPMGTGPFELQSWDSQTAVLTKNPHYWQKDSNGNSLPYLNKITIAVDKNTQVDAMHFEQGTSAFLGSNTQGIPSSAYEVFMANPKYKSDIVTQPQGSVHYLGINVQEKPFTNVLVRQAVEYAINKPRLVQLMNNRFIVANQPLPPDVVGHVENLPADVNYTYNIDKAKQLMKQAGVKGTLHTTFYVNNDPDTVKMATAIQGDLANVGIKADIRSMDWNTFLDENSKGTQPLFILDWNQDFPDASDFLNTLFMTDEMPVNDSTMYSNKQVDSLLNKATTDTNTQDRLNLYKQATVQIMKDATWVPLYYGKSTYAVQPWVHGFYINPNLADPLMHIWVDPSHS